MRSKTMTAPSALQASLQDITSALSPTTPGHPAELTTGAEASTHPAPRRVRRGWLVFATSWLVGLTHPNQAKLATFWLLALVCVAGLRSVARGLARRNPAYVQNAVIVGAGDVGQLIGRKLLHHPEYRINLLGFVDATPKEMRGDLESTELLGEPDEIGEIVRRADVDRVIVAFSRDDHEEMLALVRALRKEDVQIDVVPRLFEAVG